MTERNLYKEAHEADPTLPTAKTDGVFSYLVMVHVHPGARGEVITKDMADSVVRGLIGHGVFAGQASADLEEGQYEPIVEAEILNGPFLDPWGRSGVIEREAQSREACGLDPITDEDRASTAPPRH